MAEWTESETIEGQWTKDEPGVYQLTVIPASDTTSGFNWTASLWSDDHWSTVLAGGAASLEAAQSQAEEAIQVAGG